MSGGRPRLALVHPPAGEPVIREYYCSHRTKASYLWHPIDLVVLAARMAPTHELAVIDAVAEGLGPGTALDRLDAFRPDAAVLLTGFVTLAEDVRFAEELRRRVPGVTIVGVGDVYLDASWKAIERHRVFDAGLLNFVTGDLAGLLAGGPGPWAGVTTGPTDQALPVASAAAAPPEGAPPGRAGGRSTFRYGVPPHDLFPQDRYFYPVARHHPFVTVLASYGCPYRCSFCNEGEVGYVPRDPDDLRAELRWIADRGYREIRFRDNTFGAPAEATEALLDELASDFELSWSCLTRAEVVDEGRLRRMARAGCHTIFFGVESGSPRLLAEHKPGLDLDRVRAIFAQCRSLGIRTLAHFLFGLPGETDADAEATLRLALELEPDYASFSSMDARPRTLVSGGLGAFGSGAGPPAVPAEHAAWAEAWQRRATRAFYGRPAYVARSLKRIRTHGEARAVLRAGLSVARRWWIPA